MAGEENETPIKLLVIDDDHILTDMIKLMCSSESFDVTIVHSGSVGIEAARKNEPDVILLD